MDRKKVYLFEKEAGRSRILTLFLRGLGVRIEPVFDLVNVPSPAGSKDVLVWSVHQISDQFLEKIRSFALERTELTIILKCPSALSGKALILLKEGVVGQITGAGDPVGLYSAVQIAQEKASLEKKKEMALRCLRRTKKELAAELRKAMEFEEIYETTLENFMTALDLRDVETFGHSKTVSRYSHVLAEALGIRDTQTLDNIRKGALLHDAGKIAIPDSILKKPGPLNAQEWEKIRRHPALGFGLVKDLKLVKEVGNIIMCHHEKCDGTGYPRKLKNGSIPFEARIFALADALDAITSHRPYRSPSSFEAARNEIVRNSGTHFDPEVVDAFLSLDADVWEKIRFESTRLMPPFVLPS